MTDASTAEVPGDRTLLIVEDDKSFLQRLARAMEQRGFAVTTADSVADGLVEVERTAPAFAVVDMRLADGNGLEVISALKQRRPEARGIVHPHHHDCFDLDERSLDLGTRVFVAAALEHLGAGKGGA